MYVVVTLLILEFSLWFYANHTTDQPIQRTINLTYVCISCMFLSVTLMVSWSLLTRTPFIDPTPLFCFALINGLVAFAAATALGARRILH
ncbi:MAG: hypothetical protein ABIR46_01570 [Candidatus Saccharimonadales bacterium]